MPKFDERPRVSVVMAVFNGVKRLQETIDSVLCQSMMDFEFLIVDDGSTDGSSEILRLNASRDSRIRLIRQDNQGLTSALNNACAAATGEFIARQDVGDRSLPERFRQQIALLDQIPDVVAVGCGARRIGPNDEFLGAVRRDCTPEEITSAFLTKGTGLLHAAATFRRNSFVRVGGYRQQFRFAQDHDLWYRMSEIGLLAECPELLFEVRIEEVGISAEQFRRQQQLGDAARRCFEARKAGRDEDAILREAEQISHSKSSSTAGVVTRQAEAAYFIGSQLFENRDAQCRPYLKRAISKCPWIAGAWYKLALSAVVCRRSARAD